MPPKSTPQNAPVSPAPKAIPLSGDSAASASATTCDFKDSTTTSGVVTMSTKQFSQLSASMVQSVIAMLRTSDNTFSVK